MIVSAQNAPGLATGMAEAIAQLPDGPWYRRSEVAALVGMAPQSLISLGQRRPEFAPKRQFHWRTRMIWLYTHAQYLAIAAHHRAQSAGRPRVWSTAEAAERNRLMARRKYWRRKARELHGSRDMSSYREAVQKARELDRAIGTQRPRRG